MEFVPHEYQQIAIDWLHDHPYCGLFLDMGLGKTIITLTFILDVLLEYFTPGKILVIAPLRVAEDTWSKEIDKWNHTRSIKVSKVLGDSNRRIQALNNKADIYIINRENVEWLVKYYQAKWPFSTVVVDELSSFKSSSSRRFKALKKVRPYFQRFIGLTGTPVPRNLMDLWSQLYLIDGGQRLGKLIGDYRRKYFKPGRHNGYIVFEWILLPGAEQEIYEKISDICMSLTAADWLRMPEKIEVIREVSLHDKVMFNYRMFEKQKMLDLENEKDPLIASNAGTLMNKLTQYTNGAIYNEDHTWKEIHSAKLDMLEELIGEANGQSVLVFYNFQHDYERLMQRLKEYGPRTIKSSQDITDWNDGKIQVLLAHPASMGHGLNLQLGGHITIWFGLTWDLEVYLQANARLYRQGQTQTVLIHHIVAKGTVDEDILARLAKKEMSQAELIEAVKVRVKNYGGN